MEDLDPDSIPPEGRDPADEKARVLGLIDDRDDEEAGDACDLCNGHGMLQAATSMLSAHSGPHESCCSCGVCQAVATDCGWHHCSPASIHG